MCPTAWVCPPRAHFGIAPSSAQTAVPLQFALFELGRNPEAQERVRQQVRASWARAGGDPHKALQGAPLLKGTIKEVLRWMTFKFNNHSLHVRKLESTYYLSCHIILSSLLDGVLSLECFSCFELVSLASERCKWNTITP